MSDLAVLPPSMGSERTEDDAFGSAEREPWFALAPLPPLDRLVAEHFVYVRSVVARFSVTPTSWREDLVQEVMFEAYRSRHSRLAVRALLFGITRHLVLRWNAKRAVEIAAVAALAESVTVSDVSVEDDWHEAERRELVWAVVAGLPDIFRGVFVRAEIEQMPMPVVTRDLGIPLNTGYTRLHLARARFKEAVRRALARSRQGGTCRDRCHLPGFRGPARTVHPSNAAVAGHQRARSE